MKQVYRLLIPFLLMPSPGLCIDYQALAIQDRDDIEELFLRGEISETTRDRLLDLLLHPININFASQEQLHELPGITLSMAKQIIQQRKLSGPLTKQSLAGLPFINAAIMDQIAPFIHYTRPPLGISSNNNKKALQEFTFSPLYSEDIPTQSYFRWRYKLANHHAGVLFTHRQLSHVQFNQGSGYLASSGPSNYYNIDAIYYADKHPRFTWVLGNYNIGFGHGLTFNNSPRREAQGLSVQFPVYQDQTSGRLHQPRRLFGSGLSMRHHIANNILQSVLFFSNQTHDLYQYDVRYGPDSNFQALLGDCNNANSKQFNFTCGDDGNWYSTHISDNDGNALSFTTIRDAFDETLAGSNFTYITDASQIGFTYYQSKINFNYAAPQIHFAPAASYPQNQSLHGAGLFIRHQKDTSIWSGEISRSQNEGWASYWQWLWSKDSSEIISSYRYYHARYANPHNKAPAAQDEFLGLRQSNEEGWQISARHRIDRLRLSYRGDLWRSLYQLHDNTLRKDPSAYNLLLYVQGRYELSELENLSSSFDLSNKDLGNNGRTHSYSTGDEQGERRKFNLQLQSRRWHPFRISTRYQSSWQDISSQRKFSREYQVTFKLSYQLKMGQISAYHAYYQEPLINDNEDRLRLRSYVNFETKLHTRINLKARLGYLLPQDRLIFLGIFKLSL